MEAARQQLEPVFAAVAGTLNYRLDYWREQLGLDILALKQEIADKIRWRPDVRPFLEAVRASVAASHCSPMPTSDSLALKLQHTAIATWMASTRPTPSVPPRRPPPAPGKPCRRPCPCRRTHPVCR